MQHILVINCGSSSIKFKIIALPSSKTLVEGGVRGIGGQSCHHHLIIDTETTRTIKEDKDHTLCINHRSAFISVISDLNNFLNHSNGLRIDAIGHRVVHGGDKFIAPVLLTEEVISEISELTHLAPQHMPSNLLGITLCAQLFEEVPQVAVFDTAFHHSMPEHVYRYAVPEKWFNDYGIRRFGFHGSSHKYIANTAAAYLNKPLQELNVISLHLGNGDSACAIKNGHSIDTSMGFTPLEGLMMGHRTGDLDASVPLYLHQAYKLSAEEIEHQLNFNSGLEAICHSADMREIIERANSGDNKASLALEMFIYHVRKYIGAYLIELESIDAVIFTGGIGEHAPLIRSRCCKGLQRFGIAIDESLNAEVSDEGISTISTPNSTSKILVIPTNEELEIAKEICLLLQSKHENTHT